jgi:hypothetical protein
MKFKKLIVTKNNYDEIVKIIKKHYSDLTYIEKLYLEQIKKFQEYFIVIDKINLNDFELKEETLNEKNFSINWYINKTSENYKNLNFFLVKAIIRKFEIKIFGFLLVDIVPLFYDKEIFIKKKINNKEIDDYYIKIYLNFLEIITDKLDSIFVKIFDKNLREVAIKRIRIIDTFETKLTELKEIKEEMAKILIEEKNETKKIKFKSFDNLFKILIEKPVFTYQEINKIDKNLIEKIINQ